MVSSSPIYPFMSNTLKVGRVVPKYRQVVVGKSHVVKFMKSSLPEVEKAYRKSDYSHRKWSYVNGGVEMSSSRDNSTRVDTTRYF